MAETVVVNHTEYPLPDSMHAWPGIRIVECPNAGEIDPSIAGDVVLTRTSGGPNLGELLVRDGIEWVHVVGTGVDGFPFDALHGQLLTCSRGISGDLIGEWVFAQMLAFAKGLPDVWLDEGPGEWSVPDRRIGSLRGATVVILGTGGIGAEVARLALALEMRVIGVRRRGTEAPHPGMTVVNDLAAVIGEADHVVVAAPATPETEGLFDTAMFGAMKPGVHFCNIARGTLVDQDALRVALDDGTVARASLDVATPEPLPADHWMFDHPRVLLTPHTSWTGPGAFQNMIDTFEANYRKWRAGDPLDGVVDTAAGY
ncbi:MAG: D-2-hydroxyacid dehydrogenase [Actinomycetota bacterium]